MALAEPPSNHLASVTYRLQLAGHGSPVFYLTTTDAGGRFSKFSSPFSSAAPALHPADGSFSKSAPALTAAGDRFQKSGRRPTDAGSRPAKSGKALANAADRFTKSFNRPTAAGSSFAKSADALAVSEHAFSQLFACGAPVGDRLWVRPPSKAGKNVGPPVHAENIVTSIPRLCSQTINHQPTTDYE